MSMKYSLEMVEKGKLSVHEYLKYKVDNLRPYRYRKASGFRVVIMKGRYLFLTPKIPFWIFRYFGRWIKKIPNQTGAVDFKSFDTKDMVPLLKTLGKHNLILGVSSPKEDFQFEIWGA